MTIGMLIESLVGKAGALQVLLLHVYCLVFHAVILHAQPKLASNMRGCVRGQFVVSWEHVFMMLAEPSSSETRCQRHVCCLRM